VLIIQYSDKNGTVAFQVPSASWLQTQIVEMAGGVPVWKNDAESGGWNTVGLEQIAAWDPDMVFIINYFGNSKETANKLNADSAWKNLKAVKNNNLFGFAGDFISWDQPDPRWVLGFNWLGNKIHPDLVSFDTRRIVSKFYADFYKIDPSIINENIFPLLKGDLP
jgi:iron complex transport system substrate-binding protein